MFRFVALFALVAVAFAEPEADSQFVYSHVAGVPVVNGVYNTYAGHVVKPVVPVVNGVYNTYAGQVVSSVVKPVVPVVKAAVPAVPVVKYMNPHHTEGMTKQGVPEDTDSVKLAKEQHKFAQQVEKVNKVQYVAPYTTYAGYPYVHHPVATHFIAKREAEAEADPAVFYNAYNGVYSPYVSTYSAYPYTTAVAGYPYNKVYTTGYTGYTYNTPVVHALGKREAEADSDAALYYRTYGYNYGSPYTYNYGTPYTYGAYPYRNVYGAWY